jgi:hypothetical protein
VGPPQRGGRRRPPPSPPCRYHHRHPSTQLLLLLMLRRRRRRRHWHNLTPARPKQQVQLPPSPPAPPYAYKYAWRNGEFREREQRIPRKRAASSMKRRRNRLHPPVGKLRTSDVIADVDKNAFLSTSSLTSDPRPFSVVCRELRNSCPRFRSGHRETENFRHHSSAGEAIENVRTSDISDVGQRETQNFKRSSSVRMSEHASSHVTPCSHDGSTLRSSLDH